MSLNLKYITHLNENQIFQKLHANSLLDARMDMIKKYLRTKYNIDYMAMNAMNKKNNFLINIIHHDDWHEYLWKEGGPIIDHFFYLTPGKNGVTFFNCYQTKLRLDVRAQMFGEKKNGISLMFHNSCGNRVMFCFTFGSNISLQNINKSLFDNIIKDIKKCLNIFDPFLSWWEDNNNLILNKDFENYLNKNPFYI